MQSGPLSSVIARLSFMLPALSMLPALPTYAEARDLPQGGTVASGNVRINTPSSSQMNIHQQSNSAIVNWNSFNVGKGAQVNIQQPGKSSTLLNRVTGNTSSTIAGKISANGQVYLVNPNGIMITPTGQVNTAGFVASTLDIDDEDFKAGRRNFKGKGKSASVVNQGTITINKGGYAALMGGEVSNSGTVTVPMGKVGLASGERVTLDLTGDGFMQVELPSNGSGTKALVENSGRIAANGGRVEMKAATARNAARRAVNMSGVVEARSVEGKSGSIVLGGGQGEVAVSGTLDASGGKAEKGGNVQVTGGKIALQKATVDASGGKGGGKVRVGGGRKGGEGIQRAEAVTMDKDSIIRASATEAGNGGDVVVWSDKATTFAGKIVATGGSESGNGGEVEVSGEAWLGYTGHVDLTAANGKFGNLLLDPYNVTISTGADTGGFTAGVNNSVINVTTLQNALASANVTVSTGSGGTQEGNITVANAVTWSSGSTLTLSAAQDININAPVSITGSGGGLALNAGNAIYVNARITKMQNGTLNFNYTGSERNFSFGKAGQVVFAGNASSGQALYINYNPYKLIYQLSELDAIDGKSASDNSTVTTYGAGMAGNYALAQDLSAFNATYNYSVVGGDGTQFSGRFNGLGNTVSALRINPVSSNAGIFGILSNATVSGLRLRDITINGAANGASNAGLLAGIAFPGTNLHDISVAGTVSGVTSVGGLIGYGNSTSINKVDAAVVVTGQQSVGGLAGALMGSNLSSISITGEISGDSSVGGLTGYYGTGSYRDSTILRGSFVGNVTGATGSLRRNIGGLIGITETNGTYLVTVTHSYSKGKVLATNSSDNVGGLIGNMEGNSNTTSVDVSFSESNVFNIGGSNTGGLVGIVKPGGKIFNSYATGNVYAGTGASVGGLVGGLGDYTSVNGAYSTGAVSGGSARGALIGYVGFNSTVSNSTWNIETSGLSTGVGNNNGALDNVGGASTNALQDGSQSGMFNSAIWGGGTGGINPYLKGIYTNGVQVLKGYDSRNAYAGNNRTVGYIYNGVRYDTQTAVGASGYYYITLPADSIPNNTTIIVQNSDYITHTGASQKAITGAVTTFDTLYANVWTINADKSQFISVVYNETVYPINGNGEVLNTLLALGERRYVRTAGNMIIDYSYNFGNDKHIRYSTPGDITIGAGISVQAGKLDVFAGQNFINNSNASALVASDRWVVRAADPATSVFNGLNSNNTAYWSIGALDPGAYYAYLNSLIGNRYVFGISPTLTVTTTNQSKIYGNTVDLSNAYSLSGYHAGVTNAFLGDTASSVFTGSFNATSVGNTATANAGTYSINGEQNTAYAISGYLFNVVNTGVLTVGRRAVTATVNSFSTTYGAFVPAVSVVVGGDGLVNGDTLSGTYYTGLGQYSNVGTYNITQGTLAASSNYDLTFVGGTATVNARAMTVTATSGQERVYGNANPTLTYTTSGLVNGDTLSGALQTTANVNSNVGDYAITVGDLANSNYSITYVGADLEVTKRDITVRKNDVSMGYGSGFLPSNGYTVTGGSLGGNDTNVNMILSGDVSIPYTNTTPVGTYSIGQGSLVANGNYNMTYQAGSLFVTPRAITVTANTGQSRAYGDSNPTLGYTITAGTMANSETLAGALDTAANVNSNVGNYAITIGDLATSNGNYNITYVGANLAVNRRNITVTATAGQNRIYGLTNPALGYTVTSGNLVNSDTLSGSLTSAATQFSDVGNYAITQGTVTNASNGNYNISYVGDNLAVTPRGITVTATSGLTRAYGDSNPTLGYSVAGLVNGDTLTGGLNTTATATSGVGDYAISIGSLANTNYSISYTGATLGVTARNITVTANAVNKTYGNTNPALGYTVTSGNLVNGDALSGSLTTAAGQFSNVGNYAITRNTLTNANNTNYNITYVGANLTVTPRGITVTANTGQNRTYGNANPTLTYGVAGLVNGDTLSGSLATAAGQYSNVGNYAITIGDLANTNYSINYVGANLEVTRRAITVNAHAGQNRVYGDTNPAFDYDVVGLINSDTLSGGLTTAAGQYSNVGDYAITLGTLGNNNYSISYTGADMAVNRRLVTINANNRSRVYGNTNPALTYSATGLVNGDTLSGTLNTSATTASGVNNYAITQGTLNNSNNGNYDIAFTGGMLNVTARNITVTANDLNRMYGNANPALTYSVSGGLVNGDTLSGGLETVANGASNVGEYAITQGNLAASANYNMTFVAGDLDVTARAITIRADNLSRIYGNANPALDYTIISGNLANSDVLAGTLATVANTTSNVGNYAITRGTLGNANTNYAVTFVAGNLNVTARALTVTANDLSRVYGNSNPVLSYTASGLVNGDTLSGALATNANATSNVGNYAITQGTLDNSNYDIAFTGADLDVTRRTITVDANNLSRVYGDANPALGYTVGGAGLVNGDTLNGNLATVANGLSNVGSYDINQGTLGHNNYSINFNAGNLGVTARAITVTANNALWIDGQPKPSLNYKVTSGSLVNGDTLSGMLNTSATAGSPFGQYAINQGTLSASLNYTMNFKAGTLSLMSANSATANPNASGIIAGNLNQNIKLPSFITPDAVSVSKPDENGNSGWKWTWDLRRGKGNIFCSASMHYECNS